MPVENGKWCTEKQREVINENTLLDINNTVVYSVCTHINADVLAINNL
jgi:hypothetical protein